MIKESQGSKSVILAHERGYRILPDGRIQGLTKIRKPSVDTFSRKTKADALYYGFSFREGSKTRYVPVHKLQAYQKYGDAIFEEGIQIRHFDGDSTNNYESNIILGSQQDNQLDIPSGDRLARAIKASTKHRKFSDIEMSEIRKFHASSNSYQETMERFNISSKGTLHYILNTEYQTIK